MPNVHSFLMIHNEPQTLWRQRYFLGGAGLFSTWWTLGTVQVPGLVLFSRLKRYLKATAYGKIIKSCPFKSTIEQYCREALGLKHIVEICFLFIGPTCIIYSNFAQIFIQIFRNSGDFSVLKGTILIFNYYSGERQKLIQDCFFSFQWIVINFIYR